MTSSTTNIRDRRVSEIMRGAYTLVVTRDPEGTYSSQVIEFPGCFSGGATAPEARLEHRGRHGGVDRVGA